MVDEQTFTDTVNFKCIARLLREANYTAVPEVAVIRSVARQVPGLREWIDLKIQPNDANFTAIVAFHMAHAGAT